MRSDILKRASVDLISISPLAFRGIRRKLIKSILADMNVHITPLHYEIVRLLEEEGTLHIAEIGRKLQIAKAQMTQLIDKLVALNMIERKIDTADRRIINISLTEQGRVFLKEQKNTLMNAIQESMSCLTDAELEDLSAALRKIQDILSKLQ
jgi:DNA-binding MarR family transcriptional regulator